MTGAGPAALVLAAGRSRRMGGANKLLETLGGLPLVTRAVDALLAAGAGPVVVVTGHDRAAVERALGGRPVRFVHNPGYEGGMGTSLAAGAAVLEAEEAPPGGVLVALGDMPTVEGATLAALVRALDGAGPGGVAVPVHGGRRGHPVLFGADHLPALARCRGDRGARDVLARHPDAVREVAVDDPGVLADVDTPADLDALRR